ncbi:hypothetical protein ABZP36_013706 [Zizania latifolia]
MGLPVQLPDLAGVRRPATSGLRRGRGARFSVSAAAPGGPVKEEEEEKGAGRKEKIVIRVSDPVRERRLPPPLFSSPDAPAEPPPARRRQQQQEEEEEEEEEEGDGEAERRRYYVNMGDAIRTLREELPVAFYREPSFDIYRDDIAFKDPINNFTGIDNYKRIFWALRLTGQIFFKALWIDIEEVNENPLAVAVNEEDWASLPKQGNPPLITAVMPDSLQRQSSFHPGSPPAAPSPEPCLLPSFDAVADVDAAGFAFASSAAAPPLAAGSRLALSGLQLFPSMMDAFTSSSRYDCLGGFFARPCASS